ncbi:MAG: type II toxin-antitoxin system HipA family toxin [Rhodobacteraceae bacterium]|nr:type II toxin-antitoxin system HipA family toxin [Paracoccaceae bacterium]
MIMDRTVLVYVDLGGQPHLVGRLWSRIRKGREGATFEYDQSWLDNPEHFALEPALTLAPGPFHTHADKALFGTIGDSAPDRWGRALMRRAERRRAQKANTVPRTLSEMDYLLMVNDEARQGALRFAEEAGGPFLADHTAQPIPPLVRLAELLAITERVIDEEDTEEDLLMLLAPGSSLGGARPKASVRDNHGRLAIAKFPHKNDETNAVLWEATALGLAAKADIPVPRWWVENVAGRPVLLVERFDRQGAERIPFLSAMSLLGAKDNETRSYLEIADTLRQWGAATPQDMSQLWRRIVFNVLISNTDDHLRNHGLLYTGAQGWRLSPAYDLNPTPVDVKPRVLSTAIDEEDATASLELALGVAPQFGLSAQQAKDIAREVGRAVLGWREEAAQHGLTRREIDRMASAFEHDDLKLAVK